MSVAAKIEASGYHLGRDELAGIDERLEIPTAAPVDWRVGLRETHKSQSNASDEDIPV